MLTSPPVSPAQTTLPTAPSLSARDLQRLESRGISLEEAERQLSLLRRGPAYARIERPCTAENGGILRLEKPQHAAALEAFSEAAKADRVSKFVPASGAATRMFKDLAVWAQRGGGADGALPRPVELFFDGLEHLALGRSPMAQGLVHARDPESRRLALRELLFGQPGLCSQPKGLLPFHVAASGALRTAFDEHCIESEEWIAGYGDGAVQVHFTVGAEHLAAFQRRAEEILPFLERALECAFRVTFSCQSPATDTLALAPDGQPFRTAGDLLLRPGGHGSLLLNLEATGGDLVMVKNIDNIASQPSAPSLYWQRLLVGQLALLERQIAAWRDRLASDPSGARIEQICAGLIGLFGPTPSLAAESSVPQRMAALHQALAKPLRVCGMVPDETFTGGGPFWVRQADGSLRRQIVESVEIDASSGEDREAVRAATHFNPVLMACGLKDRDGAAYALEDWCDPGASFITPKTLEGRHLLALERPGLWNGGMAGWNTLFVEIDGAAFTPVKTINDLLAEEHR